MVEWWDRPGPGIADVRAKYLPETSSDTDFTPYLALLEDGPIGYVQVYPVATGAWALPDAPAGAGVDLFIGDAGRLHRGLGPRILRAFLRDVVFRNAAIAVCYIDPSPRNHAAIRAFEKAGFRRVADVADPDTGRPLRLMRIRRDEIEGRTSA